MKSSWTPLFLLALFLLSPNTHSGLGAESCKLPPGAKLRIACTVRCADSYVASLREAARELGYEIEIHTVSNPFQISHFDGIVSPGGHDIEPKYYTQNLSSVERREVERLFAIYGNAGNTLPRHRQRDLKEHRILNSLNHSSNQRIPYLGICYGMQMLAAHNGIPLIVDLYAQLGIPARRNLHDRFRITENTSFTRSLRWSRKIGYKSHHQAVHLEYFERNRNRHPNVRVSALSNEGRIPEIMELRNRPAIGVQFHPELTSDQKVRLAPFEWLLSKACQQK